MSFHDRIPQLLTIAHPLSPIIIIIAFLIAFLTHSLSSAKTSQCHPSRTQQTGPNGKPLPRRLSPDRCRSPVESSALPDFSPGARSTFRWLNLLILITYVIDAANTVSHAIISRKEHWWCGQSLVLYHVGSFFVYTVILTSQFDMQPPCPNITQLAPFAVAIPCETVIFVLTMIYDTNPHHEPIVRDIFGGPLVNHATKWEILSLITASSRLLILSVIVLLYVSLSLGYSSITNSTFPKNEARNENTMASASERTPLLQPSDISRANTGFDSLAEAGGQTDNHNDQGNNRAHSSLPHGSNNGWARPDALPHRSWWEYLSGYKLFFPYVWPASQKRLQFVVFFCFGLLMLQRAVNVLAPRQVGIITDALSSDDGDSFVPWTQIFLFIIYRWLQGNQGLIGSVRSYLWIPVSQYSYMSLSTAAFEHVHRLSLEFHLNKSTGEVLSALSKGNSINTFLEQITFQMLPMIIDLVIAMGFFLFAFDAYYALVVLIVTSFYLYVTVRLAQWRAEARRNMSNASRLEDAVKNDSMMSYETVKYFNAEDFEFGRYRSAVREFQVAQYDVLFSLTLMNTAQNTVFMFGVLFTSFIAAFQVATGERPVGQFVTLLTYMSQLQLPLHYFGTFYRSIQSALINAERMLELFREQPTVVDDPLLARDMADCKGEIAFDNVEFSYDNRKPALNGLSFHCKPGTTTALVGESGGGKSTVFRLLFRYYDSSSGEIRIDHEPVNNITIDSLRRHIGVVPQDTILFSESLMFNLKYANQSASDEEVYSACQAASIHERILTFPDGYNTQVGDRGMKLSGGEKQRVAIARAIIKNPRIILLDEATAALDTTTEEHIQDALRTLSRGRTVLVIAHRLSTITTADQIVVVNEGRAVEKGTHEELLAMGKRGKYATMWRKQIRAQQAAKEANVLQTKAERLRRSSNQTSGGLVEEEEGEGEDEDGHGKTGEGDGSDDSEASSNTPRQARDKKLHVEER